MRREKVEEKKGTETTRKPEYCTAAAGKSMLFATQREQMASFWPAWFSIAGAQEAQASGHTKTKIRKRETRKKKKKVRMTAAEGATGQTEQSAPWQTLLPGFGCLFIVHLQKSTEEVR